MSAPGLQGINRNLTRVDNLFVFYGSSLVWAKGVKLSLIRQKQASNRFIVFFFCTDILFQDTKQWWATKDQMSIFQTFTIFSQIKFIFLTLEWLPVFLGEGEGVSDVSLNLNFENSKTYEKYQEQKNPKDSTWSGDSILWWLGLRRLCFDLLRRPCQQQIALSLESANVTLLIWDL